MKISQSRTLIYVLAGSAIFYACKEKKIATTEAAPAAPSKGLVKQEPVADSRCGKEVTYTAVVKSIIDQNCANSCHSATRHAAGFDLSTYENVKSAASGKRLMGTIKHEDGYSPMPKKGLKMSDSTITQLECWIETGMKQ